MITVAKSASFSASESSVLKMGAYFLWLGTLVDLTLFIIVLSVNKTQWKYLTGEYQIPAEGEEAYTYES